MFTLASSVGTRGNSFKLAVPISFSDMRQRFYSVRVVSLWNNLPYKVAESGSLGAFKSELQDSLGEYLFLYDRGHGVGEVAGWLFRKHRGETHFL